MPKEDEPVGAEYLNIGISPALKLRMEEYQMGFRRRGKSKPSLTAITREALEAFLKDVKAPREKK